MGLLRSPGVSLASILTLAVVLCGDPGTAQAVDSAPEVHADRWPAMTSIVEANPEQEQFVDQLLERMSLEDKVGQIIQAEIRFVTPDDVREYRLGSVLNGGGSFPGENKQSSLEDWLELADAFYQASTDTSEGRLGIPILWGTDAVHGHNNVRGATLFPHNIGLGATRNPLLIRRIAEVTALEVAITGIDWTFGPTVAVARDDRWGRTYESYSENPTIVRRYAGEVVAGYQGRYGTAGWLDRDHLIATAKHFLGDGGTEAGIDQGDTLVTENELRDIHAAGYFSALEAGVQTVMASFNSWHGRKLHGSKGLLTDVLKNRLGFDGFVVGDWNGHGQVAGCSNHSCPQAILAGLDMFMVPENWKTLYENTLEQARQGVIPGARLDDAVRRILRVKARAGLFDRGKPSTRPVAQRPELVGSAEHRQVARQAVRESLVLLKNNGGVLPLDPGMKILVVGDGADNIGMQSGGWTLTWQGTENSNDDFPGATSIWQGISQAVEDAGGQATLLPGGGYGDQELGDFDAAVAVFGEEPYAEMVGDRESVDYWSPGNRDLELLARLKTAGIPVVSVFLSGRPLWVNPELNASDAFVAAWLPGSEGAGIADVLFHSPEERAADVTDFRGTLSFSWPKSPLQTPLNVGDSDYDPLFPFGYGLTYRDQVEVPTLPVDLPGADAFRRTSVFFENGTIEPWQFHLAGVELEAVDRRVQEDAREARWPASGGELALEGEPPVDLRRESNGAMELAVDLRIDSRAGGAVRLAIGCGTDCGAEFDIAPLLDGLDVGDWHTLSVPLSCFADQGVDMSRVDVPFRLTTDSSMVLRFSDIRLIPTTGAGGCP